MMRLLLIHQAPGSAPAPKGARMWRTCLREVAFLREDPGVAYPPSTLLDGDAYALLLEVVSGLRSPLIGETQVQAQFKSFLASLDPVTDSDVLRVGQRLLADAKFIRSQHFQGLGTRAYGLLVATHVPRGRRVALVGTGALATEVADQLPRDHHVDRWGRTPQPGLRNYHLLSAASGAVFCEGHVTVIVAAPAQPADLQSLMACYPCVLEVIDLRAADQRTPFSAELRVVTLDDIFRQAGPMDAEIARRIADARREILSRGRAFRQREELRPFGWDDLCA